MAEADIAVVAANPAWPDEFAAIAAHLQRVLGSLALSIDHIGSTAVPGLAAKDVIDIQITVADLTDTTAVLRLVEAGYNHRPQIQADELTGFDGDPAQLAKQFFREIPGTRRANLHLREQGRLNQNYPLLMRDFLRAKSDIRDAYAQFKKELANRFANDLDAYISVKDPYMDLLYRSACLWQKLS